MAEKREIRDLVPSPEHPLSQRRRFHAQDAEQKRSDGEAEAGFDVGRGAEIWQRQIDEASSFTPEFIEELITGASLAAAMAEVRAGEATGAPSQKFHCSIKAAMSAWHDTPGEQKCVGDLGDVMSRVIYLTQDLSVLCRPQPMAGKTDIFPLPAYDRRDDVSGPMIFLKALIFGLNSLSGHAVSPAGKANKGASLVLKRLAALVSSSNLLRLPYPNLFSKTRSLDYMGDEVNCNCTAYSLGCCCPLLT